MKLWHLTRKERPVDDWDMSISFVVRAETEKDARQIAFDNEGCRWYETNVWKDPEQTLCTELTADGEAEMIIVDFNAS